VIVTIDGPSASGKSTVARKLANELGFVYLNTGLLFRALAYCLIRECEYTDDRLSCPHDEDISTVLTGDRIVYKYNSQTGPKIICHGRDITPLLKSPQIDQAASIVSASPSVRKAVQTLEYNVARDHDVVAEGRDLGTVIFPHAEYKFYLTAPIEVRAKRWQKSQERRGEHVTFGQALQELTVRDDRDATREIDPLVIPPGAHVIDNGHLSIDETVKRIRSYIQ